MEHIAVESSHLISIGYDAEMQILEVKFNDKSTYQYLEVPPGMYNALMGAPSKGKFLANVIKPVYKCQKLDEQKME